MLRALVADYRNLSARICGSASMADVKATLWYYRTLVDAPLRSERTAEVVNEALTVW